MDGMTFCDAEVADLSTILPEVKALEAQQTDDTLSQRKGNEGISDDISNASNSPTPAKTVDTLSELRTEIEARIKELEKDDHWFMRTGSYISRLENKEHINGLKEALSFIDSAEARKKKEESR